MKVACLLLITLASRSSRSLAYDSARGVFVDEHGHCWLYWGAGVNVGLDPVPCPSEAP